MLRLAHVREQDPRSRALPAEVLDRRRDRAPEDVVREHYDDALVADESAREAQRFRDSTWTLLISVIELVAEEAPEVLHMLAPGDQHQLGDTCLPEGLGGVHDHRLVVDGQKVFIRDPRERIEARTGPAG